MGYGFAILVYLISDTVVEQLLGEVALLPHVLVDSLNFILKEK